jgi:hypothetical protein
MKEKQHVECDYWREFADTSLQMMAEDFMAEIERAFAMRSNAGPWSKPDYF